MHKCRHCVETLLFVKGRSREVVFSDYNLSTVYGRNFKSMNPRFQICAWFLWSQIGNVLLIKMTQV